MWHWQQLVGEPVPQREYLFHPTRRFRFDFAWPNEKVAVEIEGGIWQRRSRHTSPMGYERDCIKYNHAQALGWKVLRYTTTVLRKDPVTVIRQVQALVSGAEDMRCWGLEGDQT